MHTKKNIPKGSLNKKDNENFNIEQYLDNNLMGSYNLKKIWLACIIMLAISNIVVLYGLWTP